MTPTWWNRDGLILKALHEGTQIDWDSLGVSPDSDEFHEALRRLYGAGYITNPAGPSGKGIASGQYIMWSTFAAITGDGMRMLRAWPAEGMGADELASAIAAAISELDFDSRRRATEILEGLEGTANVTTIMMALLKLLGQVS